jgi:iron(III) transport system substrate-binding protein
MPVELSGERPSELSPKIITEQKNGVYSWDVMVASTSNMNDVLLPAGAFQPLPPFFIRDDFQDDKLWGGGKFGLYTSDKGQFVLIHNFDRTSTIFINRDLVPEDKLATSEDLLKPEFAGKIVMDHPNVPAHGSLALTGLLNGHGEAFIDRIFTEAKPVIQDNVRITTEWVATGRYPIGIGVDLATLQEFQAQGIGKNVQRFTDDPYLLAQGMAVFKNAPHPNAAKVWVNWFLSKEGQQAWADSGVTGNSRRLDVAPQMPDAYPDYSKPLTNYSIQGTDSGAQLMTQVQGIYKKYQANQ